MDKKRRNRRYRLHWLIRKEGFVLVTKKRTVYIDVAEPRPESKYLTELIYEYGYAIQMQISNKI